MEQPQALSFEQILGATLRMLRTSWEAPTAVFLQIDDLGMLQMRASDGLIPTSSISFNSKNALFAQCVNDNRVVEASLDKSADGLNVLMTTDKKNQKVVIVPVFGQARVLGVLVLGPFDTSKDVVSRESELRSAGALCAVLSAHWRLYEWMSQYLLQVNHELRTPLTAVQGSLGMVLGGVFGQVGGEVKEMLEMAQKGCERTVRAIEGYLNKQQFPKNDGK